MTTQLLPGVVAGRPLTFDYPTFNQLDQSPRYRSRTVLVESIRDLVAEPLQPITLRVHPVVNRGRFLIQGLDLDSGRRKSFYWEAMRESRQETWLTFALIDPLTEEQVYVDADNIYAPTASDRHYMAKVLKLFQLKTARRPHSTRALVVIPVVEPDCDDDCFVCS